MFPWMLSCNMLHPVTLPTQSNLLNEEYAQTPNPELQTLNSEMQLRAEM